MRETFEYERSRRTALAGLILACGLVIDAPADAGECRLKAEGRQCVASCSLAAAVTECAIATGSSACLCAASAAEQECECFADPRAAVSTAIVAFAGDRAAPERWVGAYSAGIPG